MKPDDTSFWTNLKWPAAPDNNDYAVFAQHCKGRVLLLGSTKLLLTLCDEAWDLEPRYPDPKIKQRDWFSLDNHWDTVILDGGLSYGREFTERLLPIILANCNTFITRAFLNPNWPTTYAVYFPKAEELTPTPKEIPINEVYSFYIWQQN